MGDAQSGHEKTLTALLPALAGANLIYGLGMLESGVTFDYGQLVMDDEFARMIKFAVSGVTVNDETLAVEDIAAVGSFGDFFSLDATCVTCASRATQADRPPRARGVDGHGSDGHVCRARAKAIEILESHYPEPLPTEVAAEIRSIVVRAEEDLGIAGAL